MTGYIKIYRDILNWEWWSDIKTYRLFTYMIIKANWDNAKFKGVDIPRGSFASSISKLSLETGLTVNEIRTALKHLTETGEITSNPQGKFTVFTIKNYCIYQGDNEQNDRTDTSRSQTVNEQSTRNQHETQERKKEAKKERIEKEYKEDKKDKEIGVNIKNHNINSCSEPEKSVSEPPVISLLLNDKTFYNIFACNVEHWQELYPAVDIMQELRKMKGWLESNPKRRKTKVGIKKFINSWLSKTQDSGGTRNIQKQSNSYLDTIKNRVDDVDNW